MINKSGILVVALCLLATGAFARAESGVDAQPANEQQATASNPTQSAVPPELIRIAVVGAKYERLAPWDWDTLPFPNVGDTVVGEAGGIRPALAKHNIGAYLYETSGFTYNLANAPMHGMPADLDGVKRQIFSGQKPTWTMNPTAYITYVIPKTQTQFVAAAVDAWTTWELGSCYDDIRFTGLYMNQLLLHKRIKIMVGYVPSGYQTVGLYTGGTMAGSMLGSVAILQSEVGQNSPFSITPNINIRYQITKHIYGVSGAEPSLSPYPNVINWHNPLYLPFKMPGAKAFEEQEFGFKRASTPGVKSLWLRLDGFFNSTNYFDFRKGSDAMLNASHLRANRTDNNWCSSDGVDYQATQPDKILPFRGLYVGGTVQYAPPQQNLFTQYYEARSYYIGLLRNRPLDMTTAMINNMEFSKIAIRAFEGTAAISTPAFPNGVIIPSQDLGQTTSASGQTNFSGSYLAHLRPGMWMNAGFEYTIHPTITPKLANTFIITTGLTMFF